MVDACSSSYVIWNISYSKTFSCGKQLRVHMNKIFSKNKLAFPMLEWLVLWSKGNTTQISIVAGVARDTNNTHRCVVTPGGHATTGSSSEKGSAREHGREEKNPKQDKHGCCVSGFLLCCARDQRVQPYLGHHPTCCRDQNQSSFTKNNIKSDPQTPLKA